MNFIKFITIITVIIFMVLIQLFCIQSNQFYIGLQPVYKGKVLPHSFQSSIAIHCLKMLYSVFSEFLNFIV